MASQQQLQASVDLPRTNNSSLFSSEVMGSHGIDILVTLILLATPAYFVLSKFWVAGRTKAAGRGEKASQAIASRDVKSIETKLGKNCIIFYGSQSGVAEGFASILAKEGKSRFGLSALAADLESYDYENLGDIDCSTIVMFLLATYGEGEPTDNAVDFYDFLTSNDGNPWSIASPLESVHYTLFGLGNRTYQHYNAVSRKVDSILGQCGATRIGEAGEGDDGAGTMEEDFISWKEKMWMALSEKMGLVEKETVYEPAFIIERRQDLPEDSPGLYLGEKSRQQLSGLGSGVHDAHVLPISDSKILVRKGSKVCLHLEVDLAGSNVTYQTGDHLGVWSMNAEVEVDRFLDIFSLTKHRNDVFELKSIDPAVKTPFPNPTTYETAVRYYIDISAPVSRQFLAQLAPFSPTLETKIQIDKLASDKDYFHQHIMISRLNLAKTLHLASNGEVWSKVPFSLLIEGIGQIKPRYYSISSSSLVQPTRASLTVAVESHPLPGSDDPFRGLTSNYLLAIHDGSSDYDIDGPRHKFSGNKIPICVRSSHFKLPHDPTTPLIMVGSGTGVAPLRGFVQERAQMRKNGHSIGQMMLFFGCRRSSEDYLYEAEWKDTTTSQGDKFNMLTAFSRDGPSKTYVQHLLKKNSQPVYHLLSQNASIYVCGEASHMAKAVKATFVDII